MRGKQDLFDLIQTMSRSEKRYFTLDAQKSGREEARYLRLFREINRMKAYDEEVLKQKFGASLADDKARLYETLLHALRDYRSAKSVAARIKQLLSDVPTLYERGLYAQCEARLETAKELAWEIGDLPALLSINREERRVHNELRQGRGADALAELIAEKDRIQTQLAEELHFLDLHDRLIQRVVRAQSGLDEAGRVALRREYGHLLADRPPPESPQGKLRFYQCRAFVCQLLGEREEVYHHFTAALRVWEHYPVFKAEEFTRYIQDAFNLLHACFSNPDKIDKAKALLIRLGREKPVSWQDRRVLFQRLAGYQLIYYINFDHQTPIETVLEPIEAGLKTYDLHPVAALNIQFNAAVFVFLRERFAESLVWLDSIKSLRAEELRPDIFAGARLLRLLAVIELDGELDPENTLRAAQRYFQAEPPGRLRDFSLAVLDDLRAYLTLTPDAARQRLRTLRQRLEALSPAEKPPLGLDELLLAWIRSAVEGKSLREV